MIFLKKLMTTGLASAMIFSAVLLPGQAGAVGEGPNYNGNETIKNERLTSYEDMADFLWQMDGRSDLLEVEVFGESVQGRDLFLTKFGNDPENPTVLFLTQQHGNEGLVTEAALNVIRKLARNTPEVREWADNVNVMFVPRLNVDGAEGDVNFDISHYVGGGQTTRFNANEVDLNRDHVDRLEPETYALHTNVLQTYDVDYLVDFHHQGTQSAIDDDYVSGSILYPTNEDVDEDVVEMSKQLGSVLYDAVEDRGFGLLGKYNGGSANTISRNGLANEYGIATLLFEMRGMTDHSNPGMVLGQKSNGYLIQQGVISMEAAIDAISDGSINEADIDFWDTLPFQGRKSQ